MPTILHKGGPWYALRRAPILRAGSPFLAGVILGDILQAGTGIVWAMTVFTPAVLLILVLPSRRPKRWQRGAWLTGWFFGVGMLWTVLHAPWPDEHHVSHLHGDGSWLADIRSVSGGSELVFRADAQVVAHKDEMMAGPARGKVLLTLLLDSTDAWPDIGDRILVHGRVEPIDRVPDPGGFDRTAWAHSRGITEELFAPARAWFVVDHVPQWTDVFRRARNSIADWLNGSELSVSERAVAKALVLGMRDELSRDQVDAYARSGTIHLLAVSGMHVGLIYAVLKALTGWMGAGRRARHIQGTLVLLALWAYAGVTGSEPSVMRATVMFSLFTLAAMSERRVQPINTLCAAAVVLLLWDPAMWRLVGFQLSFMAVLGILVLYEPVARLWKPRTWVLEKVWALLVVSLVAQIATGPLVLLHFKAFPIWFLPANLVVVLLGTVAIHGALLLIVLYKVPLVGDMLTQGMKWLFLAMDRVTTFWANAPGAYPAVRVDMFGVWLMYIVIISVAAWWLWRWNRLRWLITAAVATLLVGWWMRTESAHTRALLVVYDDRTRTQVAMQNGRALIGLDLEDDHDRLARKLERHARNAGCDTVRMLDRADLLGEVPVVAGSTVMGGGRWRSPGVDVMFVSRWAFPHTAEGFHADVLIFHDLAEMHFELPPGTPRPQHVVLAGGLPRRVRRSIVDWCTTHAIPCHDLRDEGAFLLEHSPRKVGNSKTVAG